MLSYQSRDCGSAGVTGSVRFLDNGTDKAGPPKPEHL